MSQKQEILNLLQMGDWVSLADALSMNPPVYRLSERIREIRAMGFEVESRRVEGKTYQEYMLIPKQEILI